MRDDKSAIYKLLCTLCFNIIKLSVVLEWKWDMNWPMVKTGVASAAKSSLFTLCMSIVISASQPRRCTAGKTRCDVDDDDGLSSAINNHHLLLPTVSFLPRNALLTISNSKYFIRFTRTHTIRLQDTRMP